MVVGGQEVGIGVSRCALLSGIRELCPAGELVAASMRVYSLRREAASILSSMSCW